MKKSILIDNIIASREKLKPFISNRKDFIECYAGSFYGSSKKNTIINLMQMTIRVILQNVISGQPIVNIQSNSNKLNPQAYDFQLALNKRLRELDLRENVEKIVLDALFGLGIAKVGIDGSGEIYIDNISLEDLIIDMGSSSIDKIKYIGNSFGMKYSEAKKKYGDDVVRVKKKSIINADNSERFEDENTYLYEVFVPEDKKVYIMQEEKVLEEREWGDAHPYHFLYFSAVPDKVMPIPFVAQFLLLHSAADEVYKSMVNEVIDSKSLLLGMGLSEEEIATVQSAKTGDAININNSELVKEVNVGGLRQEVLQAFHDIILQQSRQVGNIDTLGGLSAGAETLGQEEIMSSSSSQMIHRMQTAVFYLVRNITEYIARDMFDDELLDIDIMKEIENTDIKIKSNVSQKTFAGMSYEDMDIDIVPTSLNPKTNAQRGMELTQLMNTTILPAIPMLQQQGKQVNMGKYLRMVSELNDIEGLDNIIEDVQQMQNDVNNPNIPSIPNQQRDMRLSMKAPSSAPAQPVPQGVA